MKIMILSLLMLRLLDFFHPIQPATSLHQLVSLTEESEGEIESGELIIKETFEKDQLSQLREVILQAGFEENTQTEKMKETSYQRQLDEGIFEKVVVIGAEGRREIAVNYTLSGEVQRVVHEGKYDNLVNSFVNSIFTREKRDYACVKLSIRGRMAKGIFLNNLQDNLFFEEIDRITEPDLSVVSAYSPKMKRGIQLGDREMNLQIATREGSNNKIELLIGTPILMTEY